MSAELNQWIWDTMVSMTLLMAVVLILRKPVSHYFGAKVAYFLWALPLARLFMPILTLEAPAAIPVETTAAGAMPTVMGAATEIVTTAPAQAVASAGTLASIDWLMVAMIVWFGGGGMLFISKLASYVQFREDIVSDGQLVGMRGNIKILETAAVGGPLAFGVFRKYIAVPTDFFRNYAPRERELALEHEIAHHESGDLTANFVGLVILSIHWFNPIAWFAWVAFREDQETACDARILQISGREVRAVYGRTIAKSASGHQLGLASPLNQKDKIKGRLKMLGKSEKSGLRKRVGAFMVGTSAVIALPLTATVVYAEAELAEAHPDDHDAAVQVASAGTTVNVGDRGVVVTEKTDEGYRYTVSNKRGTFEFDSKRKLKQREIDKKLSKIVPSYRKASLPSAPASPIGAEPDYPHNDNDVVNITMLNGSKDFANDKQFVHRIKHDGKTIVLRTNRKLSDAEAWEQVAEAEESRREAKAEMREHRRDMKDHENDMREHRREMREIEREVEREVEGARREASRAVRDAMRGVREAEREAKEAAREAQASRRTNSSSWSISDRISQISFAPLTPVPPLAPKISFGSNIKCKGIGKDIAFNAGRGVMTERAWAAIVDCGDYKPKKANRKQLLNMTLRALQDGRNAAASCKSKDGKHNEKLRAFDREIDHLKRKLDTV